jgi:hypothetical protein
MEATGPVTDDEVTLGELNRSLRKLDQTVNKLDQTVTDRFKGFVTVELYESEARTRDARIASLEDRFKNASRVTVGAVIAVVIPVVLAVLKVYGGT